MESWDDRIHGTETEWAVHVELPGSTREKPLSTQIPSQRFNTFIRDILADVPYLGYPYGCFLENGTRFYGDVGDKRETTTPEAIDLDDTVAADIGNERLLSNILEKGLQKEAERDRLERPYHFTMLKQVINQNASDAWGKHLSFNVPAHVHIDKSSLASFGIHVATRNIYCGAGFLADSGRFYSAQKALKIEEEYSGSTTRARPVINSRNEPHSNDESRRVHDIAADATISPWNLRMQIGSSALFFKMIADGLPADAFNFEPLQKEQMAPFMRSLAVDTTGESLEFKEALRVQKQFLKLAKERPHLTEQDAWVIEELDTVLHALEHNIRAATSRVEWLMRLHVLRRHQERHGLAWNSQDMIKYDRRFCKIGEDSIGQALREAAWSKWMPPEDLICERMITAPSNTRANIRSTFIKAFGQDHPKDISADWTRLNYKGKTLHITDPYASQDNRVDALIAQHTTERAA